MSTVTLIVRQAVTRHDCGEIISDLQARVIAAQWHGGQACPLYALASTGAITDETLDELHTLCEPVESDTHGRFALAAYVEHNGHRGPQAGWSELSW